MLKTKILVAIPHTGLIRAELTEWILSQKGKMECVFLSHARPIPHNRNLIVNRFLQTDCTHLFMCDSDVVPPINVLDMVENDLPICSAYVCTHVNGETIPVGMVKDKEKSGYYHDFKHSAPGVHKVDAVGTGAVLIKRKVFEGMEKPYFKFVYNKEGLLINGEDFDFCERAGVGVYMDSNFRCKHYTTVAV